MFFVLVILFLVWVVVTIVLRDRGVPELLAMGIAMVITWIPLAIFFLIWLFMGRSSGP